VVGGGKLGSPNGREEATSGGQRAPAEGRVQVVRVHDPGPGVAHGALHRLGMQAAGEQTRGRGATRHGARIALEQFGVLAQALADQPSHVADGAFLSAWGPVAVVKKQDHGIGAWTGLVAGRDGACGRRTVLERAL